MKIAMRSERTTLDLIALIYDAAGDTERWPAFLETFRQASRSSATNLFVQDLGSQEFSLAAAVGMDPCYQRSYENYYKTRNVYLIHGDHLLRTGSVRLGRAMCPDSIALRSEFYNDWIAPQKQRHGMLGVVYRRRSLVSMLGGIRFRGAQSFGEEEVSLVKLLMPHLQRAVSLHRRLADLEKQKTAATDALDCWSLGVVLLDNHGRVLLMNRKAEEIMSQRDGLSLAADGLHAALPSEASVLHRLIQDSIATRMGKGGNSGGAVALSRTSSKRAFNLLVTPLFSQKALPTQKGAVAAIFLSDPDAREETDAELVRQLFDLTPAEAQLTALLISGEDLKHVAQILQVSMNTARTHLKRVFDKTGTTRQAELVRLLLQSPAQVRSKS